MKLSVTGLNHKTAPVEVRERLAFDDRSLVEALRDLSAVPEVSEALLLSTCNRVEVALTTADEADPRALVTAFLAGSRKVDPGSLGPHLYHHQEREANNTPL